MVSDRSSIRLRRSETCSLASASKGFWAQVRVRPKATSSWAGLSRRHASHSSARHLLSGAVVYLFKAKSPHAGA